MEHGQPLAEAGYLVVGAVVHGLVQLGTPVEKVPDLGVGHATSLAGARLGRRRSLQSSDDPNSLAPGLPCPRRGGRRRHRRAWPCRSSGPAPPRPVATTSRGRTVAGRCRSTATWPSSASTAAGRTPPTRAWSSSSGGRRRPPASRRSTSTPPTRGPPAPSVDWYGQRSPERRLQPGRRGRLRLQLRLQRRREGLLARPGPHRRGVEAHVVARRRDRQHLVGRRRPERRRHPRRGRLPAQPERPRRHLLHPLPVGPDQPEGSSCPTCPSWVAGAPNRAGAPSFCSADRSFTGGPVVLVQWVEGDIDHDLLCQPLPAAGAATPATRELPRPAAP